MIKTLRRFSLIFNLKALLVTLAAVLSTYLCIRYGLAANLPLTLVATAVIFPIVFSISGAYKRRENALHQYGALKAQSAATFAKSYGGQGAQPSSPEGFAEPSGAKGMAYSE